MTETGKYYFKEILITMVYIVGIQIPVDSEKKSRGKINKASQAIQSPRTVPFFLLVSLLDGYSFPNVLVKGIVAFKH